MTFLTSQPADMGRTLTKTASSVGQPYRCAMIDYSSTIFCLAPPRDSPIRDVLHAVHAPNQPNTIPHSRQTPTRPTTSN